MVADSSLSTFRSYKRKLEVHMHSEKSDKKKKRRKEVNGIKVLPFILNKR